MATERFDQSAFTRIDSISDELGSINALILANVNQLPNKPELVDQLIRRCDDMLRELRAIKGTNNAHRGDGSGSREPSMDGSGVRA